MREAARSLDVGGLLYVSTTNVLCPVQSEFNLPLYSWYPGFAKRHYERLAVTTRPALANYAKYPALNWFTFYRLRDYLAPLGFKCLDRFDMIDLHRVRPPMRPVVRMARVDRTARFFGHVLTPSTAVYAVKTTRSAAFEPRSERVRDPTACALGCSRFGASASKDVPSHDQRNHQVVRHVPVGKVKEHAADEITNQTHLSHCCQPVCPLELRISFLCVSECGDSGAMSATRM